MARFHGIRGALYLDVDAGNDPEASNNLINLTSWSLEVNTDNVDVTILDHDLDLVYKDFVAGATEWNGSFEGFLDSSTRLLEGMVDMTKKTIKLVYKWGTGASENFFVGECYITQLAPGNARDDAASFSGTFQGTGTLTWPT